MNRLVVVSSTAVIILGIVSGFLFYQLTVVQSVNNELRSQNAEFQNQLDELETQIIELQNQNSELQNQSDELQNQNYELDDEIAELQNQRSELQNQMSVLETQLSNHKYFVRITDIKIESEVHPMPLHLNTVYSSANVSIENFGFNDVENLTLTMKHSSYTGPAYIPEPPYSLDVLHSGEKTEVNGRVYLYVGYVGPVTFTLKLGNDTLDEVTLVDYNIPSSP
jgi:hypothetical protein